MNYPTINFGTHKLSKENILYALQCGITTFDTATGYNNADLIGNALKTTDLNINVITKFNPDDFVNIADSVNEHCESLSSNAIIDTVLIHTPLNSNEANHEALLYLKKNFPESRIGVCNFDIEKIQYLISNGLKPDVVSVEFHPYYQPLKLLQFCAKSGITVIGYRTFAKGQVFKEKCLQEISKKHKVTVSDIVLSWSLKCGAIPTVSSSKKENIEQLAKFDDILPLDASDMEKIKLLNKGSSGSTCMTKYCKHDE